MFCFIMTNRMELSFNCMLSYDAQRRKRALMGRFSHFQFLTIFNRYMFKLLICVLFVRKLYMSVLKKRFCISVPIDLMSQF